MTTKLTHSRSYSDFESEEEHEDHENLVELLENVNYKADGLCFIKNRERGSNEFSDCTVREFS